MFIDGHHIFSSEGTTHGDSLAMVMYSVSVTSLIASLQDPMLNIQLSLKLLLLSARQWRRWLASVCNSLSPELKRIISLSSEKGASSWLSALITSGRAQLCSPQGCILSCSMFPLWVAPTGATNSVCLWPGIFCRSCLELSYWRLSYPSA